MPPLLTAVEAEPDYVDLHAVAGGQHGRLLNVRVAAQLFYGPRPFRFWHRKLLPQLHGSVVDGQPNGDDAALLLHGVACGRGKQAC